MIKNVIYILILITGWQIVSAQSPLDQLREDNSDVTRIVPGVGLSDLKNSIGLNIPTSLSVPVDENSYVVDSGDQFVIKVDRKGPAIKLYPSTVTPDGIVTLPDAPSVFVRGKRLKDVKKMLKNHLKRLYPDATVEVYLNGIHPINVEITGYTPVRGSINVQSSDRLNTVPALIYNQLQSIDDTLGIWRKISRRRLELRRQGQDHMYDLLRYELLGDSTQNPYLQHGDVIRFYAADTLYSRIQITGAVYEPNSFEFRRGDKLGDMLQFSGGLQPAADSGRIELARFNRQTSMFNRIVLTYPEDKDFALQADDRIYARFKKEYHQKREVWVAGAVEYPGLYPIHEGQSTLSEILKQAGGLLDNADLTSAQLLRTRLYKTDKEYQRLAQSNIQFLNEIEKSYLRISTRQLPFVVNVDFEALLTKHDTGADVLLVDKDRIVIPRKNRSVVIKGAVEHPGVYSYMPGWNYEQYIEHAGGYAPRAKNFSVKIIKHASGNWLDAGNDIPVEENDVIFVPQRDDFNWYELIKDGIPIAAQIATVILLFNRR